MTSQHLDRSVLKNLESVKTMADVLLKTPEQAQDPAVLHSVELSINTSSGIEIPLNLST
ncbi:MAG: hypothetical protein RLZZ435_2535 [Cyanobacteriota bacterium]|jgi:hypothetical protein